MKITFILIMIFTGHYKGGTTVAEFNSLQTCEAAQVEILSAFDERRISVYTVCLEK